MVVVVVVVLLKEFTDEGDTNNSTAAIREKLEDDLFIVPVNMPSLSCGCCVSGFVVCLFLFS